MNNPKLLICVLRGHERYQWIAPDLMLRLIEAQHLEGMSVDVKTVYGIYGYDAARNNAVEVFLRSDAEWLCMIDNNNVPPVEFVPRVMEFVNWRPTTDNVPQCDFVRRFMEYANRPSVDIVALPYYVRPEPAFPDVPRLGVGWNGAPKPTAFIQSPCLAPGWQEVHAAAAGCMFVNRRVLTTLGSPWFRLWEENLKTNLGGGEDVDFCLRAREAGFHIWTNAELLVDHFHTVSLNAVARLARHGLGVVDRRGDGA